MEEREGISKEKVDGEMCAQGPSGFGVNLEKKKKRVFSHLP